MRAYYFNKIPGEPVSTKVLASLGVLIAYIPIPDSKTDHYPEIDAMCLKDGYIKRDFISVTKDGLGDVYEEKLKSFSQEHMHEEEMIRYVVEGGCFLDVREHSTDNWIRCALGPGDFIVVPSGIYHRFSLDDKKIMNAIMLFKEEPHSSYCKRSEDTDNNPHRVKYLKSVAVH